MSLSRLGLLLGLFTLVALALVGLRVAQAQSVSRALKYEAQWIEARRRLWNVQAVVSRLKTPQRVRERVSRLESEVIPPGEEATSMQSVRLVSGPAYE